jgi:hypothetical protein
MKCKLDGAPQIREIDSDSGVNKLLTPLGGYVYKSEIFLNKLLNSEVMH